MAYQYSRKQLIKYAEFNLDDFRIIKERRRPHNQLGFAYQLAFVRLFNHFPNQQPLEIVNELLVVVCLSIEISSDQIGQYLERRQTISEHQEQIRFYLQLARFDDSKRVLLEDFVFNESCRLEQTSLLLNKAESFLREKGILKPATDTIRRIIVKQREKARQSIFQKITESLPQKFILELDNLLIVSEKRVSPFQILKEPAGKTSPQSMLKLTHKIEKIKSLETLKIDLSWVNNNFQRTLTQYARRCSADKLCDLQKKSALCHFSLLPMANIP